MPAIKGDVELMPLADVIAWIANRGLSCTLTSTRRGKRYQFLIREGKVTQASSTDPREYLGQHLINFGYIDEETLQKAFKTQRETDVPLGKVLVMVASIDHDQLARVLSFKIRESLLEALNADFGEFKVTGEVDDNVSLDCELACDLHEAHSEAEARAGMWSEIRKLFPSDATRCKVKELPDGLAGFDVQLLGHLKSGRSIGEASLELRAMDFQVYARLYDLHQRGLVTPASADQLDTELATTDNLAIDEDEFSESLEIEVAPAIDASEELRDCLQKRQWEEALTLAERILERDPNDAEARAAHRVAEVQVRRSRAQTHKDSFDSIPSLTVDRKHFKKDHMTSKERYVLSRIDGKRSLQEIAAVSPIQKDELMRIVDGFVRKKMVKM